MAPLDPLPINGHSSAVRQYTAAQSGGFNPVNRSIEIPKDTLLDDLVSVLNRGIYSDVTLDVGKREFNVHKAILAARSPVFDNMFSNPDNITSNHYVLTDVTSRGMKELLYFIYTGHIDKTDSIVEEVLEASQKYQVTQLQAICESLILRELQVDNAVKTLILAHESKGKLHQGFRRKEVGKADNHSQTIHWSCRLALSFTLLCAQTLPQIRQLHGGLVCNIPCAGILQTTA